MRRAKSFAPSLVAAAACLAVALGLAGPALGQSEGDAPATAPGEPAEVVARVNEALLSVMREAGDLGYPGRYARLQPVFGEAFYFPFMSRVAAGRYWGDLDSAQRDRLAEAFGDMSVATFAARFDGFSGESFEIGETLEQPRGAVLVRNRLVRNGQPPVSIDYLLRRFDGRWRIIDVFLDGTISEIATKRSEYGAILKNDGFEGLLARIAEKSADLARE